MSEFLNVLGTLCLALSPKQDDFSNKQVDPDYDDVQKSAVDFLRVLMAAIPIDRLPAFKRAIKQSLES